MNKEGLLDYMILPNNIGNVDNNIYMTTYRP